MKKERLQLHTNSGVADETTEKKSKKQVFVIRRSIFIIFVFFASLIMLLNLFMIIFGLCFRRLLTIIEDGAKPPTLVNIEILAEAGSTIAQDDMA